MADFAPNYELGEQFDDSETEVVEYNGSIVAGDLLKVTGVNADNHLLVEKHTGNTKARFIALYPGADGQLREVLLRGTTKTTFDSNVTPGASGAPKANKIANVGTAGAGSACCFIISNGAANNDTGLIYFDGAMS